MLSTLGPLGYSTFKQPSLLVSWMVVDASRFNCFVSLNIQLNYQTFVGRSAMPTNKACAVFKKIDMLVK